MASTGGAERSLLEQQMAATPLFAGIPAADVSLLLDRGLERHYRKGTYLFHQGEEAPDVLFLVRGRVEISTTSVTGHRVLHTTIEEPQFFGELGVLGDMARTATALALEDTDSWAVSADDFAKFLSDQPSAALALLRVLARQVQAHEDFVDDLLFLDLKGRVAKRLLQLVEPSLDGLPKDGAVVPSVVTHADLAALCGGSRENVTRVLSEFQKRGLINKQGRRFVLAKPAGLAKLAGL
jgi:CRP/FNR family cyclic AMP-dependent transcriptional regulator